MMMENNWLINRYEGPVTNGESNLPSCSHSTIPMSWKQQLQQQANSPQQTYKQPLMFPQQNAQHAVQQQPEIRFQPSQLLLQQPHPIPSSPQPRTYDFQHPYFQYLPQEPRLPQILQNHGFSTRLRLPGQNLSSVETHRSRKLVRARNGRMWSEPIAMEQRVPYHSYPGVSNAGHSVRNVNTHNGCFAQCQPGISYLGPPPGFESTAAGSAFRDSSNFSYRNGIGAVPRAPPVPRDPLYGLTYPAHGRTLHSIRQVPDSEITSRAEYEMEENIQALECRINTELKLD